MQYFTPRTFAFLRELRENNDREWFAANKQRYEREVRDPALRFIADFSPRLARFAPHLVADPRPSGGSLFRIYRDTRFSRNKAPFKDHVGIHFFHEESKAAASVPGFYLHIASDQCFAAGGIWHPDPGSLGKIRRAIAGGPREWKAIRRSKLPLEGDSLKRPPRGYAAGHPLIDDLKRTDFVSSVAFDQKTLCSESFLTTFAGACRRMTPLVKFIAVSLALPW